MLKNTVDEVEHAEWLISLAGSNTNCLHLLIFTTWKTGKRVVGGEAEQVYIWRTSAGASFVFSTVFHCRVEAPAGSGL